MTEAPSTVPSPSDPPAAEPGRVALVTGAASGIGYATAAMLGRSGARVAINFLPGDPRFEHISSSLVKEVARFGGDIDGLVAEPVRTALLERLGVGG